MTLTSFSLQFLKQKTMMQKLFTFLIALSLTSCMCLSQIPTQYAYIDDSCSAPLPDFTGIVVTSDNCDVPIIEQTPNPGTILFSSTNVEIRAIDGTGNERSISFDVVLIDTIPPTIQLNPEWSYTPKEVGNMYRTFYGWVQYNKDQFVKTYQWDTLTQSVLVLNGVPQDGQIIFNNSITYPDTTREDWWWAIE